MKDSERYAFLAAIYRRAGRIEPGIRYEDFAGYFRAATIHNGEKLPACVVLSWDLGSIEVAIEGIRVAMSYYAEEPVGSTCHDIALAFLDGVVAQLADARRQSEEELVEWPAGRIHR